MGFYEWYSELNADQKQRTNLHVEVSGKKKKSSEKVSTNKGKENYPVWSVLNFKKEREKVSIFWQPQSLEKILLENKVVGNIWKQ